MPARVLNRLRFTDPMASGERLPSKAFTMKSASTRIWKSIPSMAL